MLKVISTPLCQPSCGVLKPIPHGGLLIAEIQIFSRERSAA